MIDPQFLHGLLDGYYGSLPHPDVPDGSISVKEYDAYARAAARMHETPNPSTEQVVAAHHMLTTAEISPSEFERLWDAAKPLANQLLDRPPTMTEIAMLNGAHPGEIQDFYRSSPHPNYPHIPAGDMADMHHSAAVIALEQAGRWPNEADLATFVSGNYDGEAIRNFYQKAKRNG